MKLKFKAKAGHNCYLPGTKFIGQINHYIGQQYVTEGKVTQLVHDKEPAVFDSHSKEGKRAVKHCKNHSLYPADEQTAKFCGVPFIPLTYKDGQWIQKIIETSNPEPIKEYPTLWLEDETNKKRTKKKILKDSNILNTR